MATPPRDRLLARGANDDPSCSVLCWCTCYNRYAYLCTYSLCAAASRVRLSAGRLARWRMTHAGALRTRVHRGRTCDTALYECTCHVYQTARVPTRRRTSAANHSATCPDDSGITRCVRAPVVAVYTLVRIADAALRDTMGCRWGHVNAGARVCIRVPRVGNPCVL